MVGLCEGGNEPAGSLKASLGFRPMPEDNEASSLIAFKSGIKGDFRNWTTALDDFLEEYEEKKNGSNVVACSYATKKLPDGKVCAVKQSDWGPCTSNKTYGFQSGKPCVFIKLNKIIKWEPEYFKNAKELPDKMPDDLRKRITELVKKRPNELNTVWVSCEGEKRPDKENQGEIEYFPHQGFPGYYYPFTRQQNYLSPLIALHFKSIKNTDATKPTLGCSRINETYPGCWIGRVGVISWPPRSPDLTPLDYCVWGWLKSEVYKRKVKTREELLARILHACAQVKQCPNQLRSATQQLSKRAEEKKELVGSLPEEKLPAEGFTGRNSEWEKSSEQKKISNDRYVDHMRRQKGRQKIGKTGVCWVLQ
ncbi:hypothetical protein ANN_05326 [Periplaneta americana]|uniref:Uncharacterized protein n=1 Tax=Periplaneta americana TaxID=6978 RepID=A0ABQ8TAS8_PERAM|nr:hypothetical protein ANN_05326 [Periplaneta americana]